MENQEIHLYGLIAVIILAVIAIGLNCFCIYTIFRKRGTKCECDNDPEKNIQSIDEEVSGLEKSNDGILKEGSEVDEGSSSKNASNTKDVAKVAKTESLNSTTQSISTNAEENLERLVRKMEVEMLAQKMEQQQSSGSESTLHLTDIHKKAESSETPKPLEFKSIPTNVNMGSDIIPTVWKESEKPKIHHIN